MPLRQQDAVGPVEIDLVFGLCCCFNQWVTADGGELTRASIKKGVKQEEDFSYTAAIQQPTGVQTSAVKTSQWLLAPTDGLDKNEQECFKEQVRAGFVSIGASEMHWFLQTATPRWCKSTYKGRI